LTRKKKSPVDSRQSIVASQGRSQSQDEEALRRLEEGLDRFRREPYESLKARVGDEPIIEEGRGTSGRAYQIELIFLWDDRPDGNVRVMASIDDGGWRAFVPATRSFIKAPDGRFVGE
jgi:hypothetical protein